MGGEKQMDFKQAALKNIPTKELVEELSGREGIEKITAEPYAELNIPVSGPAVVMVVID